MFDQSKAVCLSTLNQLKSLHPASVFKRCSTVDLVIANQAPSPQLDKKHAVIRYFQGDLVMTTVKFAYILVFLCSV